MHTEKIATFADNWAYLKTELAWLERLLMLAVTRQRKDSAEVDRLAQTRADRATSHWWRGVISLEGSPAYDEHRPPSKGEAKLSYQQQMEQRIASSRQQQVGLALPMLCDRLQLTPFEKNLVLIALAPDVSRRYAQLYRYLQGEERTATELPMLDLVLRLLCRTDQDWREARSRLRTDSPLCTQGLLQWVVRPEDTLLSQHLKLAPALVDFLVAEQPTSAQLERLLAGHEPLLALGFTEESATPDWAHVILPPEQITTLQHLALQGKLCRSGEVRGAIALFIGASGLGKTWAAGAIAHDMGVPLTVVDLDTVPASAYADLFTELERRSPPVLLLKAAQHWLRRRATVEEAALHRFWQQRQTAGITLLAVPRLESVAIAWQHRIPHRIAFAMPAPEARLQLWQQAFSPSLPLSDTLPWAALAQQLVLSGGDIQAIAQTARVFQQQADDEMLTLSHLQQAIAQHGHTFTPPKPRTRRPRSSTPSTRRRTDSTPA
ncbi:MAG: hypothetical protein KME20_07320 [Kaiparowitsia implicata GSE-PSE-MK54-09C]|jgi:hypothetical protein|nr:hypothetical protein [Kaiparowitsia implicata GSE-PSE-MK54-09C]